MATVTALPASLREKLTALTRRIRWLQALRGVALLLFTLALTAGAALLADAWLDLPGWGRGVLLAAWVSIGSAVAIAGLAVPLVRRLRPETLAAVIEAKYPALAERLTSTVELADAADAYHGSPALIAVLKQDTETQTRPLNFLDALPGCPALRATATVAVVVLFATPALIWPGRFGDLAQRFLMPWYTPPIYAFDISPDATVVARGRPLTLSVQITPRNDRIPLPRQSILVKTDAEGRTDRLRMTADRSDSFSINFNVTGDFRYHIEADGVASLPRHIQAVEPVALEPDSPTVTITPPAYAQQVVLVRSIHGLADLSELQYSKVRYDFRFTQPVVSARLEKVDKDTRKQADRECESLEVSLLPDRLSGFIVLPMLTECGYRLRLVGEHAIGTDFAPVWLSVKTDQPPVFLKPERDSDKRERHALAHDSVPLDIVLLDDYGVDRAEVEYRIERAGQKDAEKTRTEPIALEGSGTQQASARYQFPLSGKVKEGDTIRYRIKAQDNRRVPEVKVGPNVIYYPADHWLTLKIAARGTPLQEQDILAQRDDINQRLEALQKALRAERDQLFGLKQEAQRVTALNPAQLGALGELKKRNRRIEDGLRELAREAAQTAALLPLAEKAQDVAAREMRKSGAALNQAGKETSSMPRDRQFSTSDQELLSAIQRLESLKKENNQLAQARLDQAKLDQLARRQQDLAERTAEQALKDPIKDPASQPNVKALQREQEELARDLQRLSEQSEPLRNAQDANRAQQAEQLAEQLRDMARQQRELAQAFEQNTQQQAQALGDLARKQQELAQRTERLAQETRQPAQTSRTTPLRPEDAQKAAEALQQGDAGEAMRRQERAAQELDRVAAALDRAIDLSRDPREAARQLAALQEGLRQRLAEATQKQKDPAAKSMAEQLQALQPEQQAIQRAAAQLSVPAARHSPAIKQRELAADRAAQAAQALKTQDPKQADARMTEARKALEQLANNLPSLQQRQRQTQTELAQLRRQQDQIAASVDHALEQAQKEGKAGEQGRRDLAQRLQDAARSQAETAERLGRLDAAGQEDRQERAQNALNRALADLMDARTHDLQASQQEARRQLERLQQALAGQKPADELARDLARRQQELAEQAADPQATPQQRAELPQRQRRIAQETQALQASEAPQRRAEAVEATHRAQQAADAQPASPQTQHRLQEAARALDRLAQQLNGNESDAARAERLAREQAQLAGDAERQAAQRSGQRLGADAQRRQQQIAQEARDLRGGVAAPEAKQKAVDALARAQQTARPGEQAQAQRQAADALRELAEQLAGRTDPVAQAAELARQQRELADEVARQRRPEQAVQAAQRQAELARRLERLDARPAADAQKQAAEQMARAQKNLERTDSPADVREHVAKAADAAEALARQLAQAQAARPRPELPAQQTSLKPSDQSGRALAQELAKRQRALAQATQQAQREAGQQPGEPGKQALQQSLDRLAEQQRQLNQQASQLPANQAQQALQQARQVMDKAQQALTKADAARAQQKQQEAAGALERLAQQLPERNPPSTALRGPADSPAAPQGLPTREQAQATRQLAEQQRDLQRQVQRALEQQRTAAAEAARENPAGELVKQQQAIARQAGDLARDVGQEQGGEAPPAQAAQQAAQSAQQTSNQMQNGALPQAQKTGQQTARDLRQLAQQLAQTPRPANGNASAPDPLQQARQLAQQQEELNRKLEPLASNPQAQRAQQLAQQQELQRQADQAAQRLNQLAQQMNNAPQARAAGQQAAATTQQAARAMQQAQNQAQQGNASSTQQNQQEAAQRLDQAAQRAGESAKQMAAAVAQRQPQSPGQAQTGQSLQQAQGQMAQAQNQLGQNQSQAAQGSMQQAANSLQQAANQMAQQPGQPGQPTPNSSPGQTGVAATGQPDLSLFSKDMKQYAGKPWGELPGELRTRLLQQMKEKYGDDYARIIKLYFEQIAETKKK